ncbi:MAG: hypothetical protein HGA26_00940 [Chlorobiaceae bacterium]|nr:hypothetical protein [Chlorobiaceae bacterium]
MIPGDAKKHDGLSDDLAERLSIGVPEARHLLCAFSRGMAGELLASGSVSLGGVGSFSIAYVPSEKKTGASGIIYTSPGNRLVFEPKVTGRDDSRRIAMSGVSFSDGEAERFRRAFLAVFSAAVRQKREIRLKGFGTFAHDDGNYKFFPERSFDELLNRQYLNLDEVVLPPRDASVNVPKGRNGRKNRRPLVIVSSLLCAAILSVVLYVEGMPGLQGSLHPDTRQQKPVPVSHPAAEASSLPSVPPASSVGDQVETHAVDSLALAKGDFTIVLATFRRAETANDQARRLRADGVKVFVWPLSARGLQYFRLATGKFSTARSAAEALKTLPSETDAGKACIQKVIKGIVLHGEKGL